MKYRVVFNIPVEVQDCKSARDAFIKAAEQVERIHGGFRPTFLTAFIYESGDNESTYFYHTDTSECKKI